MSYSYTAADRLETPNTYMYTPFEGKALLDSWAQDRKALAESLGESAQWDWLLMAQEPPQEITALTALDWQADVLLSQEVYLGAALAFSRATPLEGRFKERFDTLLQRFEVTKKIYHNYGPGFRKGSGEVRDLATYGLAAWCFTQAWKEKNNLKYLNVLIKLLDTISSVAAALPKDAAPLVRAALEAEAQAVATLSTRVP